MKTPHFGDNSKQLKLKVKWNDFEIVKIAIWMTMGKTQAAFFMKLDI